MYMPDAIAAYTAGGETYLVTANEGDARDYDGFAEEKRVGDLVLDWSVFPTAAELQKEENLGRLTTTTAGTDTNGDGLVDRILTFGGRSFSIWSADGKLVFDSGSAIVAIAAAAYSEDFNADGENGSFDSRSDAKGPEPEALTIGEIGDRTYAFVCLERIGGIVAHVEAVLDQQPALHLARGAACVDTKADEVRARRVNGDAVDARECAVEPTHVAQQRRREAWYSASLRGAGKSRRGRLRSEMGCDSIWAGAFVLPHTWTILSTLTIHRFERHLWNV